MFDECGGAATWLGDLSQDELAVWLGFVEAHGALSRGLDEDLRAAHGLPLSDFKILLWLSQGPCARMRMAALADMVQLSPSGLSRAIERLETRGLVSRQQSSGDRRGVDALLTEDGSALVQRASKTHAAGIRRRFLEHLSSADLQALGPACERLRAANQETCSCSGVDHAEAPRRGSHASNVTLRQHPADTTPTTNRGGASPEG